MCSHGPQTHKQGISGQECEDQVQPWHGDVEIVEFRLLRRRNNVNSGTTTMDVMIGILQIYKQIWPRSYICWDKYSPVHISARINTIGDSPEEKSGPGELVDYLS